MQTASDSRPTPPPLREYRQSDIGIASFLVARGFKLLGLARSGKQYQFRFADPVGDAQSVALLYLQNEPVPAKTFFDSTKTLKSLLYNLREEDRNRPRAGNSHAKEMNHATGQHTF